MPFSTYDASVGMVLKTLKSLDAVLASAEEHAATKNLNVDDYVQAKLYEDMKPLDFQVRSVAETATKCAARLLGQEAVDLELQSTFAGLRKQTTDAIASLEKVDPDSVEGKETKLITMGLGPGKTKELSAKDYIVGYSVPNSFFHLQTSYAILRQQGVPLGKRVYIAPFSS
ncbi:conserved hypothetical protein [Histoplasma capsulatum G186AR]|uniref:DUF1993 domain-containing protein n=2 Tax=Ajellomyces capsulatus TaxID=5037 RepID=C0NLY3_AJECG|nr:uncharacterized protein HCBG_04513 [Histoplasma capsulatum G186AR]EEH07634.1 conserved hypothetical protein [Histoplasma capsulatum G186AR]KAG5304225.1 DUF1993 superfamily domain-containing protein [Histoplasma capsulatum]QSS69823.1 DUF1993 superfamily domain-containing protein [Histoplasma capsulatum G186AR]